MAIESAKAFIERIKWDTDLRKSVVEAEEKAPVIKKAGFDFTMEEWQKVKEEYLEQQGKERELSDKEVEGVAAGGSCYCFQVSCYCFQV